MRIVRLGCFVARAREGSQGNIVMWRGLSKLAALVEGFSLKDALEGY